MYLAVDGGGSKLMCVVYDGQLRPVCRARSGGVNPTQNSIEAIRAHISEAVGLLAPYLSEVTDMDEVFVGAKDEFESAVLRLNPGLRIRRLGEPEAGLLAGACRRDGLLALAGTGSDVFVIRSGRVAYGVGGWGPVMGDQGSGAWIGLQALRSVCRAANGWGEKTMLTELFEKRFGAPLDRRPPEEILKSKAPYAVAAGLVPLVGQAAHAGDRVALEILERAGQDIALQLEALFRRAQCHDLFEIVLCGGAWKAHGRMLESCQKQLRRLDERYTLKRPCFEHVLAGPALRLLENGFSESEARLALSDRFPEYIIDKEAALA